MTQACPTLNALLQAALERDPPRAKSLCMTLLGDAIEPHGGAVWLSGLIELVTPLGINERLLRTSVFRLVAQGLLTSERHGRRSLYRLSERGQGLTRDASARIYDGTQARWDGQWTLVVLPRFGNSSLDRRGELRRQLIWAGFGAIAPGVFALPRCHAGRARQVLRQLKLENHALILDTRDLNAFGVTDAGSNQTDLPGTDTNPTTRGDGHITQATSPGPGGVTGLRLGELVSQCWDLDRVSGQYQAFIDRFGPMAVAATPGLQPVDAFAVRALALHEWRRIVLHDPQLPVQMLPADWPGLPARALCGRLYWAVFDQAEVHLAQVLGKDAQHFGPLQAHARMRFGGRLDGIASTGGQPRPDAPAD
ncbi:phenylacetic acid degradation operon negative regulatory protein PaaX [Pusillimonas sp. TS35]|nr:phenylacetic acid degradation operon negative regulatory protein PaaX [Pusillimonas sp. TS35]